MQTGNPDVLGKGRLVLGSLDSTRVTFTGRHDIVTEEHPVLCALPFLCTPSAELWTSAVFSKKTHVRNLSWPSMTKNHFILCLVLYFFWPHPWHEEVPGPGIESVPQQQPEPQQ